MTIMEWQLKEDCELLDLIFRSDVVLMPGSKRSVLDAIERLKNEALKNIQTEPCKCLDHEFAYAKGQWEKPIRVSIRKGHLAHTGSSIPMVFNHCPECGRKLKK
jgi:hypothetical protein